MEEDLRVPSGLGTLGAFALMGPPAQSLFKTTTVARPATMAAIRKAKFGTSKCVPSNRWLGVPRSDFEQRIRTNVATFKLHNSNYTSNPEITQIISKTQ
eukprot:5238910-Amphidinium_carterae.2